jgi:hypothetical protein
VRGDIASEILKFAFEDAEPLVLTGIGRQFVFYALNEVVTRIGAESEAAPSPNDGPVTDSFHR